MKSISAAVKWIFLFYIGAFLFLFSFRPIETDDIWWQLKTGQWIAAHGGVPHVDPFSFANEHTRWVCNHWLGSLVIFLAHQAGGLDGLRLFKSLIFLAAIGMIFFYARRKIPLSWLALLSLPIAYGLLGRLLLRPDVFNFFFIQIFLIHLFAYENTGERKNLFALVLWGIVWSNIHLGSFVYGTGLIGVFLASAVIRSFRTSSKQQVKELGLALVFFIAAFGVSPYGIEGFLFPFKSFLLPDYLCFYQARPNLSETQPPWWMLLSIQWTYYHILVIMAVWIVVLNRKDPWTLAGLVVASIVMFLSMVRNGPFLTLVCCYVIAEGAGRVRLADRWAQWSGAWKADILFYVLAGAVLMWHIVGIARSYEVYDGRKVPYLSVSNNYFRDSAVQLLIKNKIFGPVFNEDVFGNELLWKAYPQLRPFWDCRFLSNERYAEAMSILKKPKTLWPAAQEKHHFKIVVLDAQSPLCLKLAKYLDQDAQWQLIAVKGPMVLFVKKGEFVLSEELEHFKERLQRTEFSSEDNARLNELLLRPVPSSFALIPPARANQIDVFIEGGTFLNLGYYPAAFKDYIQTLLVSNEPKYRNAIIGYAKRFAQ